MCGYTNPYEGQYKIGAQWEGTSVNCGLQRDLCLGTEVLDDIIIEFHTHETRFKLLEHIRKNSYCNGFSQSVSRQRLFEHVQRTKMEYVSQWTNVISR
jgi:hypothetical protein